MKIIILHKFYYRINAQRLGYIILLLLYFHQETVRAQCMSDSGVVLQSYMDDSLKLSNDLCLVSKKKSSPYHFKITQMAVPAVLVTVGIIGLESDWLEYQNSEIRDELQENIDSKFTVDDFSQYVPMAAVYGLNLCGVKGKHDVKDQTIILATSAAIMAATVNVLKVTTREKRPDGSSRNSFPSGHTATAFIGAELLRREYWDVSPWIGVTGYAVALGTGFFRMYNNRHWFTDVLAGAGVGILSVKAAYWLYPSITKLICRKHAMKNTYLVPYYSKANKGVTCSITF